MINFFKRLFKIGQAEANSAIDKMEDPIKLTEQGVRDLKGDLEKNIETLAQVKALAVRAKNDIDSYSEQSQDYENKAALLLKKAQSSEISMEEAERLAKEALVRKEESIKRASQSQSDNARFNSQISQLESNIKTIKSNISKYENELRTLRARAKVSKATRHLNEQLAQVDSESTVSMLERMKEKVAEEEALAEAYGDIASETKNIDDEIDKALEGADVDVDKALADLKAKLGISGSSGDAPSSEG